MIVDKVRTNRTLSTVFWVENAAGVWALIFGILHVVWTLGWYIGLNEEEARVAFAKPLMVAYNGLIILMCFAAAVISQTILRSWGALVPRKMLAIILWSGSSLLILRAFAGFIQSLYLILAGKYDFELRIIIIEGWFYLGAILWGLTVYRFRRRLADKDPTSKSRSR